MHGLYSIFTAQYTYDYINTVVFQGQVCYIVIRDAFLPFDVSAYQDATIMLSKGRTLVPTLPAKLCSPDI